MSKHLTEKQKNIIIKLLAEGVSQRSIAKQLNISQQTISQNPALIVKADSIKKAVLENVISDAIIAGKTEVEKMSRIINDSLDQLTPAELAKQNAYAKAMILGTVYDKRQLATGGITDDINIRDSSGLVDSLAKKYKGKLKSANKAENKPGIPIK